MSIEVLFSDITISFGTMGKSAFVTYGVVNERQTSRLDVVIVRGVHTKDPVSVPDPESGWTEAVSLRTKISILTGSISSRTGVYVLENPRIVKEISSETISSEIIRVIEGMISGEVPYINNIIPVDGLSFKILRYKPPSSLEEFETILTYLQMLTAGRKRVMICSPAFVEVSIENEFKWCVVSIPRVVPYLWEAPSELVAAGIIDPGGFNAPFIVVRNMSWRDLTDIKKQMNAVRWLNYLVSQFATKTGGTGAGPVAESEEPVL
ncbi:MAG: hypothetical protein QXH21_07985 [Ignisphaera sp.]